MKLLIFFLLIILTSCNENKNQIISKNYAPLEKKIPPCICEYWYNDGVNPIPFQDSCKKYSYKLIEIIKNK